MLTERLPAAIRQRSCRIGLADWSFGKTRFNFLVLGVDHNGVAFSVVWDALNKKGNSNSKERMDLIDRFYATFPDAEVGYLTGDREFIGKEWLTYLLLEPKIPFCWRIRNSDHYNIVNLQSCKNKKQDEVFKSHPAIFIIDS